MKIQSDLEPLLRRQDAVPKCQVHLDDLLFELPNSSLVRLANRNCFVNGLKDSTITSASADVARDRLFHFDF